MVAIEYRFPASGDPSSLADPAYTGGRRAQFVVARLRLRPLAVQTGFTLASSAGGTDGGAVLWSEAPCQSRASAAAGPLVVDFSPKLPDCLVLRAKYEAAMRRWGACWGASDAAMGPLAGAPCVVPFLQARLMMRD